MAQLVKAHALNNKVDGSTPAWDGGLPTPPSTPTLTPATRLKAVTGS